MAKPRGAKHKHQDVDLVVAMILAEMLDGNSARTAKPAENALAKAVRKNSEKRNNK